MAALDWQGKQNRASSLGLYYAAAFLTGPFLAFFAFLFFPHIRWRNYKNRSGKKKGKKRVAYRMYVSVRECRFPRAARPEARISSNSPGLAETGDLCFASRLLRPQYVRH